MTDPKISGECATEGPCTCGVPFKKVPHTGPCPGCDKPDEQFTHADRLFGCCNRSGAKAKFKHMLKVDREYREDLARFPNDPEAYVDGPAALKKLVDKRKREGCQVRSVSEVSSAPDVRTAPTGNLWTEAYQEAKASNFKPGEE